ncbi:rab GTPase-activating protein 22-like [Rutidosis leptorrhynchoides]|uniref:rab GTPase-activating protein 22-like n=1 Tax=Rutidosis leptorrhynchoides TaxID=125765 RepID=UPI003A99048E
MKAVKIKRSHTCPSSSSSSSSPKSSSSSSSSSSSWIRLRSVLFVVNSISPQAPCSTSDRGRLKSPWSRIKRRSPLRPQQWKSLFTQEGKLKDSGVMFLKKVRSRGVDPSIRAEVWPFLLGVYELNSTKTEREIVKTHRRKEYENLRRKCRRFLKRSNGCFKLLENEIGESGCSEDTSSVIQDIDSSSSDDVVSARDSLSSEDGSPNPEYSDKLSSSGLLQGNSESKRITSADQSGANSESSDSDSCYGEDVIQFSLSSEDNDPDLTSKENVSPSTLRAPEDFTTWQRIIRVDAVRANSEWIPYSPSQATVSESRAHRSAEVVGLKDYDHLEPCRIFHAARLVAILEAYAIYDPEIGYCQGMSDLLSPIISVMTSDHEAFWCFVAFMKKARHNFRLDEVGIRRQLSTVSKIIKCKDYHLYRHLEKLEAEDCFFVYRMVVVLFRRELTFEQTISLWEVMWADQAAIRAGIGKSAWSRIRLRAPPTEDLLLFAIAASVLQRRKLIVEKYNSMDEIFRECNDMAGQLDVWKLLDDAHDLVVTLHDKIERSFHQTTSQ